MPPTDLIPNLFGERKVFFLSLDYDKPWFTANPITELSLTEDYKCDYKEETKILRKSYTMQLKLRPIPKKSRLMLLRIAGLLKPRKTTYKTIRKNCAKRNRYK